MKQSKNLHHGVHRGHGVKQALKLRVLCVLRGARILEVLVIAQVAPFTNGQITQHDLADTNAFQT